MEVRQRMKLTGTNSSIGLIVLIDYAHLKATAKRSSGSMMQETFVLTRQWRCGRPALPSATGLWPVWVPQASAVRRGSKDVFKKRKQANACQLLKTYSCALPTWWLWRGGCTRSLSEHGRETPLRPWYFVLRRGRVGRCQVCKAQLINLLITKQTAQSRNKRAAHKAAFRVIIHQQIPAICSWRGVEQPVRPEIDPLDRFPHGLTSSGYA